MTLLCERRLWRWLTSTACTLVAGKATCVNYMLINGYIEVVQFFFQLNAKTFDANYPQCNFSTASFLFRCKIYFKLKISAFTQVVHSTVFLRLQFLNWLIYSKFYNLTVSKRDLLTTNFTFLSLLPLCDLVLAGWLWSLTLR